MAVSLQKDEVSLADRSSLLQLSHMSNSFATMQIDKTSRDNILYKQT